jgi:CHAT domain-containing protein
VLRAGEVSAVDLGPAAEVDAAVTKLRAALGDPDLTHDARPAGREAYDRIFAPIAAKLGGVAHVLWSPDGALSLVPLGALVAPDGRWLVESRLYTYVTSGRDLLRFEGPATPRSGPLVIAAPDFGPLPGKPVPAASRRGFEVIEAPHPGGAVVETSRPGGAGVETSRPGGAVVEASHPGGAGVEASHRSAEGIDMSRIGFLPLPGTAREAEAVERTLAGGALLVGDQATESAVKWAHAPSVLHIATHGFFLPDAPIAAASAAANASGGAAGGPVNAAGGAATGVAPGLEASGSEAALAVQAESPLVRSGLAFAGANQRASGSEDGILSGLEASTLDLAGTELVVLSACETGLGAAVPGDGVYGLRRAFAIAGAETLVMSLWQVDTGRTRELMTAYYEALATGAGRGEAMRRAQLGMLANEATAHPNLWASFIVSGRWTPLTATKLVAPPKLDPGPRGCACDVGVGLPAWSERASSEPAASDRIPNEQPASVRGPNAQPASVRGPNERVPAEGTAVLAALALAGWRLRRLSPRRHTRRAG